LKALNFFIVWRERKQGKENDEVVGLVKMMAKNNLVTNKAMYMWGTYPLPYFQLSTIFFFNI